MLNPHPPISHLSSSLVTPHSPRSEADIASGARMTIPTLAQHDAVDAIRRLTQFICFRRVLDIHLPSTEKFSRNHTVKVVYGSLGPHGVISELGLAQGWAVTSDQDTSITSAFHGTSTSWLSPLTLLHGSARSYGSISGQSGEYCIFRLIQRVLTFALFSAIFTLCAMRCASVCTIEAFVLSRQSAFLAVSTHARTTLASRSTRYTSHRYAQRERMNRRGHGGTHNISLSFRTTDTWN